MTYEAAVNYLKTAEKLGSKPGIERITRLLDLLSNPQDNCSCVHITGTNGKGSTGAMLESILRCGGSKTGFFSSPHLVDYCDSVRINAKPIPQDVFSKLVEEVSNAASAMSDDPPTVFELMTAIAFLCFSKEKCDVSVIEVGMGGRLDSTNVIKSPLLSVITDVELEHTAFLGDTVEKIASEKSGIIKNGCPVLWGGGLKEAEMVIKRKADSCGSEFYKPEYERLSDIRFSSEKTEFNFGGFENITLSLLGGYQPYNAAIAITAARLLGADDDAIYEGLRHTKWRARFERIDNNIYYDGAHNLKGMQALEESILQYFGRVNSVVGILSDKEYEQMAKIADGFSESVFTLPVKNPRSLSAHTLASCFSAAIPCENLEQAVSLAKEKAAQNKLPIVIFGSLYMYAEAAQLFNINID